MIDTLVNNVETEMQGAKLEEKDAQGVCEKFMSDAKAKRAEDSNSMTDNEAALADTSDSLWSITRNLSPWKLRSSSAVCTQIATGS